MSAVGAFLRGRAFAAARHARASLGRAAWAACTAGQCQQAAAAHTATGSGLPACRRLAAAFSAAGSSVSTAATAAARRSGGATATGQRATMSSEASSAGAASVTMPTSAQLRALALQAAVPMVGFGIMDQTIMIQAGDLIDSTLGSRLALPTLYAAACGQVFSDFSGVLFGGTVEAAAGRMGLPTHGMSSTQLQLPVAKRWSTMGAACGVVVGCLLGMTQMWFMDLRREEQVKEFDQVNRMLELLLKDDTAELRADRASLYFVDCEKQQLWTVYNAGSSSGSSAEERVCIEMPWTKGIAGACARTAQTQRTDDAYSSPEFNSEFDKRSGRRTRSVLCVPVLDQESGKPFAVLQFLNKRVAGQPAVFTVEDQLAAEKMAHYIAVLLPALQPVIDSQKHCTGRPSTIA